MEFKTQGIMEKSFTLTFMVDESPENVFDAITNVRGWWTPNLKGNSRSLNDEFEVRFGDVHYSKQKLTEVVQNEKVVWLVTDSQLSFINNKREWVNTRIIFEIKKNGVKTQVVFTHEGLLQGIECYDACSDAWSGYILGSLRDLVMSRQSQPTAAKV